MTWELPPPDESVCSASPLSRLPSKREVGIVRRRNDPHFQKRSSPNSRVRAQSHGIGPLADLHAMTFKFYCECGQKVSATEDMVGTTAVCPRCSTKMTVPTPEEAAAAAEAAMAAPPSAPSESEPAAQSPPARTPTEPATAAAPRSLPRPKTTPRNAPTPVTVARRPLGLLWLAAFLAGGAALGAGGYIFRGFLKQVPDNPGPLVIGTLAAFVASLVIALFLKLAVRVVARIDLAFLEAWLVTIFTLALNVLAAAPVALTQLGLWKVEQGAKLLPITTGVSLLLTVIAYSFLIWNAFGRPIGVWRGVLTYLLQAVFIGALGGIIFGIIIVYSQKIPSTESPDAPAPPSSSTPASA